MVDECTKQTQKRVLRAVREYLEPYGVNEYRARVVSGECQDGAYLCDTNGIHEGDETNFGLVTYVDLECVRCEKAITRTLKVKTWEYVSDKWIVECYLSQVRPIARRYCSDGWYEEWLIPRNGRIYLSHRPVGRVSHCIGMTDVDYGAGIVSGNFHTPQYVKYQCECEDWERACVLLTASAVLGYVGAQTGGGSLSVQGYSRQYGERGKWHDARQDMDRAAYQLLQKYVVGMV